jgi:nucleotide-binding universal stress UspA family protein
MSKTIVDRMGVKSVLVSTDFSEASERPLRHGVTIARHFGAKLCVAHVVSSLGFTIAGEQSLALVSEGALRELRNLERGLLEKGNLSGLSHEFIVREGDVWKELKSVIREKQVDLIVVGIHVRRDLERLLLGSVAEQIFREADELVLTIGPRSPEDAPIESLSAGNSFVFATDFTEPSLSALPHAISFANHFGVRLVFLHVDPTVPIPESFHWSTAPDIAGMREQARLRAVRNFEEIIQGHEPLSVKPEFIVEFGKHGEQILRVSRSLKASLIILGLKHSEHARALSHFPATTAYNVVVSAHCPVLTVRS